MPASPIPVGRGTSGAPGSSGDDACPGALRLHAADDGGLARIRIPGGLLPRHRARALGDAAREFGDGVVRITSRGNAEVRGVDAKRGAEFGAALRAAGLLPSAAHERVRNILASPLSGLDDRSPADVREWLLDLDQLLCASTVTPTLSGKFLFALDDGRGDVAALAPDILLRATPGGRAVLRLAAEPYELRLAYEDAARAAVAAAEEFVAAARDDPGRGWRVAELTLVPGELTERVARRTGAEVAAAPERPVARPPKPGPVLDAAGAVRAWSVQAPFGAVTPDAWSALLDSADGEVRLTPWRGIVVPGADSEPLARAGFVTAPDSPWTRVSACVGRPGCAKSHADVRAEAAAHLADMDSYGGLPVYWSGCERRCGHPTGPYVDVVAQPGGGHTLTVPSVPHHTES
ncbi:cobalamin biosynthesis protein CobG [Streptomyces sp. NPDC002790]|uniref:cobalamin biosynthesis protein CobG n=1 Tax=Streptomyces sp. NPDC002790 TaxID=3154431 RepID=UPI0033193333